MSRAEDEALKAYPKRGWKCKDIEGNEKFLDANRECRLAFIKGYEQAISDIAWIVLGEKMRQNDVSIERVSDAIKNSNVNGIVNAINANSKELSKELVKKKYKAKKLERGRYLYRGFIIECVGYIDSQHRNAWQAHDDICDYCAQSGTLKEAKMWVDDEIDNNHK